MKDWALAALIVAVLGQLIRMAHEQEPAPPYYAKPTQYEIENGPPGKVCKYWGGDGYATPADRVECVTLTGGDDEN